MKFEINAPGKLIQGNTADLFKCQLIFIIDLINRSFHHSEILLW